jgi:hypothetical protein
MSASAERRVGWAKAAAGGPLTRGIWIAVLALPDCVAARIGHGGSGAVNSWRALDRLCPPYKWGRVP